MNENQNAGGRYADIIGMRHPDSLRHPRMGMRERAAQFSPFAALTGYEGEINETARLTDVRVELNEDEKAQLNAKLMHLAERLSGHPQLTATYFQPDPRKEGGAYRTVTGALKRLNPVQGTLQIDAVTLPFDDILDITGEGLE